MEALIFSAVALSCTESTKPSSGIAEFPACPYSVTLATVPVIESPKLNVFVLFDAPVMTISIPQLFVFVEA